MQEFTAISSSSYDPSALAAKLNDKSAEGWSVVSIVSTGGDVTAFLSRDSTGHAAAEPESSAAIATSTGDTSSAPMATYEPMVPEHVEPAPVAAASEPAGWAVAPEASSPQPVVAVIEPIAAATTYTPAPAPAAAATPAVPAGWYADPAGRFELRYWDGGTWTEHVSRAGQQFTDPPVA
ncbi:MAG: hypothetical protein JWN99_3130 [Ilumatobacteraceae bacterium]|nr:hypothetical protein [Ilumatobacteraceae bacterium]